MKTVQLVVTGRCEQLALHTSLGSLFPQASFREPIKVESFTSAPLTAPAPPGIVTTGGKFARKLVELVDELEETLVIGVEDQEFEPEPSRQVEFVRERLLEVLSEPPSSSRRERLAEALRHRCSFHRLVPMVETYFFLDPAALHRAGATRQSRFEATTRDVEDFEVVDSGFTAQPDSVDKDDWCRGGAARARHPKRYLKYLTGSGSPGDWTYRESKQGRAALASLDWRTAGPGFATSARALFGDIADWLSAPSPLPGEEAQATSRHTPRRVRVLRNL